MDRKKYVVMMAAGSGSRMGADKPKQFLELGGKAILHRAIEVFLEACPGVTVITVLPDEHIAYWKEYCYDRNFICPQILVKGGITRFHSVRNALAKVPDGALVAIHDGVRPLVSPELVRSLFSELEKACGAIPIVPCIDTMKVLCGKVDDLHSVPGASADRSVLYGAQTPQIFQSELWIRRGYFRTWLGVDFHSDMYRGAYKQAEK
jgi:2-C-methyl-D-erythritol 4-phosphate cytidylyltransferase